MILVEFVGFFPRNTRHFHSVVPRGDNGDGNRNKILKLLHDDIRRD